MYNQKLKAVPVLTSQASNKGGLMEFTLINEHKSFFILLVQMYNNYLNGFAWKQIYYPEKIVINCQIMRQ